MNAKEQLPERGRGLSETEAGQAIPLVDARRDPLNRRLDDSPPEDEEISPKEDAAVQRARDELTADADPISHHEIKREFRIG